MQYDTVKVRTSPSMIVHWAMQYAGAVEILDEEIRERIRDEIAKLKKNMNKESDLQNFEHGFLHNIGESIIHL